MIVQVVLSIALIGLSIYAYTQRARSRVVAWGMFAVCAIGEMLVLAPERANQIAHFVGVGRGADLIMYGFIVATLGLILNLHLRLHELHDTMTALAREIALKTATSTDAKAGSQP